ncbi:MAG: DUF362 domain-containing protein [Endomicrobium sp.]|jgi:uncharacterized protein (DUF362 family)/Pyruvate/2-oxoacid:ferredoxin oxidoreductase delta subunit|nr:DUF362 domain-containing protein [Endomicrobium sp.]
MLKISLLKCDDYNKVYSAVNEAVELIGGIDSFIRPGEKVLIKPNLLSPKEPEKAVTTHPAIVKAVIKLVKKAEAVPIVGDSPGGAIRDIKHLWKKTGMQAVCEEENVELVNFEAVGSKGFDINDENVRTVNFSNAVLDCDAIINLPKLKTHSLMSFTAGVKNLYGCVPGIMKVEYHKYASKNKDFADLLANIYDFLKHKIRFTLIDGILAMEGNGPGNGDVRKLDLIAACADAPLLDAYLLHILKSDISSNYVLKSLNVTAEAINKAEIIGSSLSEFSLDDFKFPALRKLDIVPKPIVKLLGKFLWVKAKIDEKSCKKCMLCAKSCPASAINKKNANSFPEVDESKCISCFCCHELCPYKSVGFHKSLLAKIFIKED